jgi:phenylacetate-CoA ligase
VNGLAPTLGFLLRRWPTREAIRAFQDAQLRRLVTHAAERVPRYRRLFAAHGVRPGDVRGVDDLGRLPMTERREIQASAAEDLVAGGIDPERLIVRRTSGSSGRPILIRRSRIERHLGTLVRLRIMRDLGVGPSDRRAGVGLGQLGHPHTRRLEDLPRRIVQALGVYRSTTVNCRLDPEAIADALARIGPDVIFGYPGALLRVAQAVARRPRHGLAPRLVLTGAEVLAPGMRQQIAEGLRARVLDWYGSHEVGMIAWECRRAGGYHVWAPGVALEVLVDGRPAAPGETGEVVVTSLHSFAMPFIRYRLADLVVQGDPACACGAPFATLREIRGRRLDYFELPDGRGLHPYALTLRLLDDAAPWLGQYQFTQEARERIALSIVPVREPSPAELAHVRRGLDEALGAGVDVQIRLVADIPLGDNGKFRVVRSLVRSAYDGG